MRVIDQEQELRRELPKVFGNADYREYAGQLDEIDRLLIRSGIEARFVDVRLARWEQAGQRIGTQTQLRHQKMCVEALRVGIARQLTEREYRKFAMRLAESFVLQRFCRVDGVDGVAIPSKSTLERYDKLAPECEIREREVAWAVLAHNLWVLARMLRAQEKERKKAA